MELFLTHGDWEGKRIVPADWIRESLVPGRSTGRLGMKYGYCLWLTSSFWDFHFHKTYVAAGFGDQWIIAIPHYDLVIVVTGWNLRPGEPSLGLFTTTRRVLDSIVQ
jgi:CubicO group peptidase (beta-lactamase class C family)